MKDNVNHPSHYTFGRFEVADVIDDWNLDWKLANCVKYIARHSHKGKPLEDLKKARWYLDRMIEQMEVGEMVDRIKDDRQTWQDALSDNLGSHPAVP